MQHLLTIGGEHALGVELYAANVHRLVAQGHDLSLVAFGSYLKAVGQSLARNHPRVVAADGDVALDAAEDGVIGDDVTWCGNTLSSHK